jgi:hypothetical protein
MIGARTVIWGNCVPLPLTCGDGGDGADGVDAAGVDGGLDVCAGGAGGGVCT